MFRKGLVKEVTALIKKGLSKTAKSAIGIKEIVEFIKGKCELTDAKEMIKKHTRQYAKRQLTWFKKDKRVKWINLNNAKAIQGLSNKIKKKL